MSEGAHLKNATPDQELKLPEIHNSGAQPGESASDMVPGPHGQQRVKRTLVEAQKARKKLQDQAQLLANRIALLKQQEVRTWKKIEETRKRAVEVKSLKAKNQERYQKHLEHVRRQSEYQKINQRQLYELKKNRETQKEQIFKAIERSKRDDARHAKLQAKNFEAKRREYLDRIRGQNQMKTKIIREQERYAQMRLNERKQRKLEEYHKNYESRIDDEEQSRQQKELEVQQMEMMEMDLIKRLQHTQAIQKSAYSQFQEALAQPVSYVINPSLKKKVSISGVSGKGMDVSKIGSQGSDMAEESKP